MAMRTYFDALSSGMMAKLDPSYRRPKQDRSAEQMFSKGEADIFQANYGLWASRRQKRLRELRVRVTDY